MKTSLLIGDHLIDLEAHLSRSRTIVTLGRCSDEAFNVLAFDDEALDLFQCQFTRTADGAWTLHNGQWRTECPKGIRSRLQHACALCMGCCVNVRPAHPTYSWRFPVHATLFNGQPVPTEGITLHESDVISVGTMMILVTTS